MVIGHVLTAGSLAFDTLEYNRDGFAAAAGMRQNQMYQEKSYHINLIAALRQELRDFMTIFVGRMSNIMIMDTLLFGIAAGFLCEGEINESAADFMVHAYYTSMVVSVLYFGLSMVFAVLGVTLAYSESRQFLLNVVPDPLDKYDFDYMSQLKEFERDSQAYRVPVLSSLVMSMQTKKKSKEGRVPMEELPRGASKQRASGRASTARAALEQKAEETIGRPPEPRSYFEVLGEYNSLWEPCSTASHECMAHGIFGLCQGFAMFVLGHNYDRSHWGSVNLFITLILSGVLVANRMVSPKVQSKKERMRRMRQSGPRFLPMGIRNGGDVLVLDAKLQEAYHADYALLHFLFAMVTINGHQEEPQKRPYEVEDLESGRPSPEPMLQELLRKSRRHSRQNSREATRVIAAGHAVAGAPWLSLCIWMIYYAAQRQSVMVVPEQLDLEWPSHVFHAHALSCAGGESFISNKLGIYRIEDNRVEPLQCVNLAGDLRDMTAGCGESCWNLALTSHGLVNCSSSQEYPWAKSEKVNAISWSNEELYYWDGTDLIQERSRLEMPMTSLHKDLKTFDVWPTAQGNLFFFFSKKSVIGETLRGACVEDRHSVLLAMQDESPLPRLLRVKVT
ncbi:unnamed protein product [Durusdinium trenchii]|uniref:Uncharacterized protein n=1 Tax=Durusdinium trenchii TaxID=1381693 RepID=A0ABP0HV33_9DINO